VLVPTVGETDILVLYLEQADGTALNYASKALFQAAGFDLTWKDATGTALDPQPDWDLVASASKRHQFEFTKPAGPVAIEVTTPSTHISTPKEILDEGLNYDADDIGSMLASTGSVSISPTATTTSATMYDGDSIFISGIVIPEAALTAIGASSLANCDSRLAFIKRNSQDSNDAPDVAAAAGLTVTALTDDANNRTVKVECTAFPAVLGVPDDSDTLGCTLQVRLVKGSKEIVAAEVALTVHWVAPQGEAVDP
jgi:hypothetical protein